MTCRRSSSALLALLLLACTGAAEAQTTEPPPGPLTLRALQRRAADLDPRTQQIPLYGRESDLRTANINAERRPSVSLSGHAQYQSDVPQFPFASIAGIVGLPFGPPKDTYDASARVDQRLIDPTTAPRLALEQAQAAESQARVRATLFSLRQQVNDAFFTAALLQARGNALGAAVSDLEARLGEMNARVREGTAVVGDAAAIEATLLQRRQEQAEVAANRHAALARLSSLTGQSIGDDAVLTTPVLAADVSLARDRLRAVRERPEYTVFERSRTRLSRQEDVAAVENQPRASAYGTGGLGRPGLNYVSHQWEWYWLAGVQVEWRAWDWGTRGRDREALAVQRQIVAADEAAFTADIERAVQNDLASIDRLGGTLAADDRIITLRETIDRSAHARFRENTITAADYLDRSTELLDARFNRVAHEIELAEASARFLNTLGIEVP
jgi:outer membrane protein TolC